MKDKNSLAHTQWRCKYHLVFAPKYRRQIIYRKYKCIEEIMTVIANYDAKATL